MTTIIFHDISVPKEKKSVVLSVTKREKGYAGRIGVFKLVRTNGKTTETIITSPNYKGKCKGKCIRYERPCTYEDWYDYTQDVSYKQDSKRNDYLMKDINNAYNMLYRKGYLYNSFGFRGWVREIDHSSAKLVINTKYDTSIIVSLLKLHYPSYEFEVV